MCRRRDSFDEKDILKAIDILLGEVSGYQQWSHSVSTEKSEPSRGGGGGGEGGVGGRGGVVGGGGGGGGGQERRRGRQVGSLTPDLTGFEQDEVCEVTGFESRKREECKVRSVREKWCRGRTGGGAGGQGDRVQGCGGHQVQDGDQAGVQDQTRPGLQYHHEGSPNSGMSTLD